MHLMKNGFINQIHVPYIFFSVPTLPPTIFISIDIPLPGNIAYGLALKITDNNYVFTTQVMVWP